MPVFCLKHCRIIHLSDMCAKFGLVPFGTVDVSQHVVMDSEASRISTHRLHRRRRNGNQKTRPWRILSIPDLTSSIGHLPRQRALEAALPMSPQRNSWLPFDNRLGRYRPYPLKFCCLDSRGSFWIWLCVRPMRLHVERRVPMDCTPWTEVTWWSSDLRN